MNPRALSIVVLLVLPVTPVQIQPYARNIAKAEEYLARHFNGNLQLIYESEDPGPHWLRCEFTSFQWRYNQTYWLYSDNLFAYLALRSHYPELSDRIRTAIQSYRQPPADFFEVLGGERIQLPLHDAQDFIVAQSDSHVVLIRRHNSTRLAFGNYVDFWMYEALEYALEYNLASAVFLVHRAEALWRGNGLSDWSFTVFDHMFSNQKLALLLFTARAIGIRLVHEDEMEAHLWSMQNDDGGIASLSYPNGKKAGSANAETTALTILIYNQQLLAHFPKVEIPTISASVTMAILPLVMVLLLLLSYGNKRRVLIV